MQQNEQATSTVIVNGEQAKSEMTVLEQRAKKLKEALMEANKAGDAAAYNKLSKELKNTQKEMKQLEKSSFDVKKVLDNLSGSSLKDLEKAQRTLNAQLRSGDIKRNTQEWKDNLAAQKAIKTEIRNISSEMQVGEGKLSKMANGFNKYFAIVTAGAAAFTGITVGLKKFMDARNELEDSKANLKALTGLGDSDIEWLTEQAKQLSSEATKAGIRIRSSAKDIVDAYTIVGSAKPELLKSRDGLKEVTEQALILATASKMPVVDSAKAITTALNMYGASARDAARYTNVLGAGAKEGAAEVSSQTESILKSGVAASRAKIPIEQLVGSIQALADKGIKDEIAGTGLKTFFIKLQSGAKETNPAIVGLQKALENLQAQNLSSEEIQKRFGLETFTVAAAMIDSAKKVEYYTKAVTDTNVAVEQAQINSQTVAARLAQAQEAFSNAGQELVKNLNPAILTLTNGTTAALKVLVKHPGILYALAAASAVVAIAYARSTIATVANTAALRVQAMWTDIVNSKTVAFFKALATNPYTYIIAGAIAGIAWLNNYLNKQKEVNKEQNHFNDLAQKSKKLFEDNQSLEDRFKLIGTLSKDQLEGLRSDVEQQLAVLSNFDAEILTRARKAYDQDSQLVALRKKFSNAKTDIEKAYLANLIKLREEDVFNSIAADYKKNDNAIKLWKSRLASINKLMKSMPDPSNADSNTSKETPFEKAFKKREKAYKDEMLFQKQVLAQQFIDQDEYEQNTLQLTLDYNREKLVVQKKFGEDTTQTETDIADAIISINKKTEDKLSAARKEREKEKKEADDEKLKAEKEFQEKRKAILSKYGIGENNIRAQYDADVRELKNSLKEKLISQQEYEEALRKVKLKTAGRYIQQAADIAQEGSNLASAMQEAESLAIDNKYAKQIKAAKKAGKDTTKLEEQAEEEKKQIKKKYADISFAISVAQIITNTALAITRALAELGPIAGPIMAGVMGVTGLAEIAVANQQREAVKNLWTGGFTDPGNKYEPRGIVHAGEFVANQDAVGNRSLRRVFNLIDHAQRTNTVARLTPGAVAQAATGSNAGTPLSGSAVSEVSAMMAAQTAESAAVLAKTESTLAELTNEIKKGIKSYAVISGRNGLREQLDLYDSMNSNKAR